MRQKSHFSAAPLAIFLFLSASLFAHHGTGISYDMGKTVALKGVVTEFAWSNPHCQIYFDVKDDSGNVIHWATELGSPGVLRNAGWNRNKIKPGDEVTITVHPSKVGAPVGVLYKVLLPDGKEWNSKGQVVE